MRGESASAASTSSCSFITSLRSHGTRRLNLAAVLGHLVRGLRWLWSNPCLRLPTAAAVVYPRRQLGCPTMRHLFQQVGRPMSTEQTRGAFRFSFRLLATASTTDDVSES